MKAMIIYCAFFFFFENRKNCNIDNVGSFIYIFIKKKRLKIKSNHFSLSGFVLLPV